MPYYTKIIMFTAKAKAAFFVCKKQSNV